MWIEYKGGEIVGPARIGWVEVKDKGNKLIYREKSFRSLKGRGFKSNFYDIESGEEYWITGCRKDGRNALYSTEVEVDEDALEEYWTNIRRAPEKRQIRRFHVAGKY
jgi:hypothetical protein